MSLMKWGGRAGSPGLGAHLDLVGDSFTFVQGFQGVHAMDSIAHTQASKARPSAQPRSLSPRASCAYSGGGPSPPRGPPPQRSAWTQLSVTFEAGGGGGGEKGPSLRSPPALGVRLGLVTAAASIPSLPSPRAQD